MKILVKYPSREDLSLIVERTIAKEEVHLEPQVDRAGILELRRYCRDILVAPHVKDFAVELVLSTQPGTKHTHPLA
ncbi:hypothetical protein ABK046_49710, partial [Streptomyces caeruleatus]